MFRVIVAICSFASILAIDEDANPSPPMPNLDDLNISNLIGKWKVAIMNTQFEQAAADCLEYNFSDDSSGPSLVLTTKRRGTTEEFERKLLISRPDDSLPTLLRVEDDYQVGYIVVAVVNSTENLAMLCIDYERKPVGSRPASSFIKRDNVLLIRDISKLKYEHYDIFSQFLTISEREQPYWTSPDHTVCP